MWRELRRIVFECCLNYVFGCVFITVVWVLFVMIVLRLWCTWLKVLGLLYLDLVLTLMFGVITLVIYAGWFAVV